MAGLSPLSTYRPLTRQRALSPDELNWLRTSPYQSPLWDMADSQPAEVSVDAQAMAQQAANQGLALANEYKPEAETGMLGYVLDSARKPFNTLWNLGQGVADVFSGDWENAGKDALRALVSATPFSETAMDAFLPETAERDVAEWLNPVREFATGDVGSNKYGGNRIRGRDLGALLGEAAGETATNTDPSGSLFSEFGESGLQDAGTVAGNVAQMVLDPLNFLFGAGAASKGMTAGRQLKGALPMLAARKAASAELPGLAGLGLSQADMMNPVARNIALGRAGVPQHLIESIGEDFSRREAEALLDFTQRMNPQEQAAAIRSLLPEADNPLLKHLDTAEQAAAETGAESLFTASTMADQYRLGQRTFYGGPLGIGQLNRTIVEPVGAALRKWGPKASRAAASNEEAVAAGMTAMNRGFGAGSELFRDADDTMRRYRARELSTEEAAERLSKLGGASNLLTPKETVLSLKSRLLMTGALGAAGYAIGDEPGALIGGLAGFALPGGYRGSAMDTFTKTFRKGFLTDAETAATQDLMLHAPQFRRQVGAVSDAVEDRMAAIDSTLEKAKQSGAFNKQEWDYQVLTEVEYQDLERRALADGQVAASGPGVTPDAAQARARLGKLKEEALAAMDRERMSESPRADRIAQYQRTIDRINGVPGAQGPLEALVREQAANYQDAAKILWDAAKSNRLILNELNSDIGFFKRAYSDEMQALQAANPSLKRALDPEVFTAERLASGHDFATAEQAFEARIRKEFNIPESIPMWETDAGAVVKKQARQIENGIFRARMFDELQRMYGKDAPKDGGYLLQRIREVLGNADDRARDIGSMKPIAKPPTRVVASREVAEGLARAGVEESDAAALVGRWESIDPKLRREAHNAAFPKRTGSVSAQPLEAVTDAARGSAKRDVESLGGTYEQAVKHAELVETLPTNIRGHIQNVVDQTSGLQDKDFNIAFEELVNPKSAASYGLDPQTAREANAHLKKIGMTPAQARAVMKKMDGLTPEAKSTLFSRVPAPVKATDPVAAKHGELIAEEWNQLNEFIKAIKDGPTPYKKVLPDKLEAVVDGLTGDQVNDALAAQFRQMADDLSHKVDRLNDNERMLFGEELVDSLNRTADLIEARRVDDAVTLAAKQERIKAEVELAFGSWDEAAEAVKQYRAIASDAVEGMSATKESLRRATIRRGGDVSIEATAEPVKAKRGIFAAAEDEARMAGYRSFKDMLAEHGYQSPRQAVRDVEWYGKLSPETKDVLRREVAGAKPPKEAPLPDAKIEYDRYGKATYTPRGHVSGVPSVPEPAHIKQARLERLRQEAGYKTFDEVVADARTIQTLGPDAVEGLRPAKVREAAKATGPVSDAKFEAELSAIETERAAVVDLYNKALESADNATAKTESAAMTKGERMAKHQATMEELDSKMAAIINDRLKDAPNPEEVFRMVPARARAAWVLDQATRLSGGDSPGFVNALKMVMDGAGNAIPNDLETLVRYALTQVPQDVVSDWRRIQMLTSSPNVAQRVLENVNQLFRSWFLSTPTSVINDGTGNMLVYKGMGGYKVGDFKEAMSAYLRVVSEEEEAVARLLRKGAAGGKSKPYTSADGLESAEDVVREAGRRGAFRQEFQATQRMKGETVLDQTGKAGAPIRFVRDNAFAIREINDNGFRAAVILAERKAGASWENAISRARQLFPDYADMTRFEGDWARRMVLFYGFVRRMAPYALRSIVERPYRFKTIALLTGLGANRDNEDLPEWARKLPGYHLYTGSDGVPVYGSIPGAFTGNTADLLEGNIFQNIMRAGNPLFKVVGEAGLDRDFGTGQVIGFSEDHQGDVMAGRAADTAPAWMRWLPEDAQGALGYSRTVDRDGNVTGYEMNPRLRWVFQSALPLGQWSRTADTASMADERKGAEALVPGVTIRPTPQGTRDAADIRAIQQARNAIAEKLLELPGKPMAITNKTVVPNRRTPAGKALDASLSAAENEAKRIADMHGLEGRARTELIEDSRVRVWQTMYPQYGALAEALQRLSDAYEYTANREDFERQAERKRGAFGRERAQTTNEQLTELLGIGR